MRPWYEKKDIYKTANDKENAWYFSDQPFDLSNRSNIRYFLDKIAAAQENTGTLVFLTGINRELLPEQTSKPGFNDNLKKIDGYFGGKPVSYVNYDGKIDYRLYTDYVHLTPEGYRILAEDLWSRIKPGLSKG
jgi:lysophospholipase L1-like esterase